MSDLFNWPIEEMSDVQRKIITLHAGDIIRCGRMNEGHLYHVEGAVWRSGGSLLLGEYHLMWDDGLVSSNWTSIEILSRVNIPAKPIPGTPWWFDGRWWAEFDGRWFELDGTSYAGKSREWEDLHPGHAATPPDSDPWGE